MAQPPETSYAADQKYTKAAIDTHRRASGSRGATVTAGPSSPRLANHPERLRRLVYIAAFALDEGESCASIEQALPQASKAFKPDSNDNWWIDEAHFAAADFAADISTGEGGIHGYIAGADLHRLVHP